MCAFPIPCPEVYIIYGIYIMNSWYNVYIYIYIYIYRERERERERIDAGIVGQGVFYIIIYMNL